MTFDKNVMIQFSPPLPHLNKKKIEKGNNEL